jgi:hypothetical protein
MEHMNEYDVVLSHLISEGYADNFKSAENIIEHMSEEWIETILSEKYGTKKGRHKLAMKIKAGKQIGKKNVPGKTGFKEVEKRAKKYGATDPAAVAAAAMWKKYGK